MANKQIIDYALGAVDLSAVLLQQPAAGGVYTKVTAPIIIGFKYILAGYNQSGVAAPTITAVANTIGAIGSVRNGPGDYEITSAGLFPPGTVVIMSLGFQGASVMVIGGERVDNNTISVQVFDSSFFNADLDSNAFLLIATPV